MIQPSTILVVGLGKTGHSIAAFLTRKEKSFILFDTRTAPPDAADFVKHFPDNSLYFGTIPTEILATISYVIASPGVALTHPILKHLSEKGIKIIGDIECLALEISAPVVAITGTNGKSTVTALVGLMAEKAGFNVGVAGNIGTPVLDLLEANKTIDLWVLELSSFQLDLTYSLKAKVATLLNISPDHLDRHGDMDAYIAAKMRIYQNADMGVYNRDDEVTKPKTDGRVTSFGLNKPELGQWGLVNKEGIDWLANGKQLLMPVNSLKIKGRHNIANALAAAALATNAGIDEKSVIDVLQTFPGLSHRTQWVRTIDQVDYINDSKGTNIGASESAIVGIGLSIHGKIVLIAGGVGKGADFHALQSSVSTYVRAVVLIGEDAPKLEEALGDVVEIRHAQSFEDAIKLAQQIAKPHDVVLLSPACASFDMFSDYAHRGEVFTTLVDKL